MFVELLGRSCFSFLRGASTPEELVAHAQKLRLGGLALCDLDGLYGAVRAWKAAGPQGVRLLVGAELTLANQAASSGLPSVPEEETAPTVALLVQTAQGYESLCRLLSKSHDGQDKGVSVCDSDWLLTHNAGLFALLVAPRDPRRLLWGKTQNLSLQLKQAFFPRLAVATYRHLDGLDQIRESWVIEEATKMGCPVVASARPFYHERSRKPLADVVRCIRLGLTLEGAEGSLQENGEKHLRSEEQMRRLFRDHPDWVQLSERIAATCQFHFGELKYHFPCELREGQSADERLTELTWEGVGRRFPQGIDEKLRAQIIKELCLIKKIQVAPYFLSTYEIVEMARRRKILCQGRGSAANSAVCFMLGITAVDPARSHLLFERFLSEERAEPPDIDIDFEHERREEIIQEIYARYGRERSAMVSEIISYRRKGALRDVGKVFGFSLEQVSRLSGTVTWHETPEILEKRLVESGFDLADTRLKQVVALAEQLRGFPRHLSIHVGGFVLSSRPLYEVAPIEPARMEGRTVIPWDKDDIDALGFFKVDVLALGMLTAIRKALQLICESGGLPEQGRRRTGTSLLAAPSDDAEFDPLEVITRIPPEDPSTYQMISRGDTVGVFQIESRAQMSMLPRLKPKQFYDLVIEVAIVRPGPIQGGMVHPFLRRRNGEEAVTCPHPALWPILKRTLGVPLFQEQVMQIAIEGAGYSGGEADQLRRDMAAWKKHGKLLSHRERLLSGFKAKGISREFGEALFEQIKGFGEYGFPESHASSFALLVYASSWEKRHYPAHFTCALLNSQPMGFYPPTSLIRDAQKHGVEVRDICIKNSLWDCTLEPEGSAEERLKAGERAPLRWMESQAPGSRRALRLGFRLIRGLGERTAQKIVRERQSCPYSSLEDLIRRAVLKRDEIEALAESGALDMLEPERRNALWKARAPQTPGLFLGVSSGESSVLLPALSAADQLVLDYKRKGLSVYDHPLAHYRRRLRSLGAVRAEDLEYLPRGREVCLAGLVMSRQRPATASGVVFITLEDETGSANLIVYASVFEKYNHVARHSQMLFVSGEVERDVRDLVPAAPDPKSRAVLCEHATADPLERRPVSVIHIIVRHLERWGNTARPRLSGRSRDFH